MVTTKSVKQERVARDARVMKYINDHLKEDIHKEDIATALIEAGHSAAQAKAHFRRYTMERIAIKIGGLALILGAIGFVTSNFL